MSTVLYILSGLYGVVGFFVLVAASKDMFRNFGLTLGGLAYIAGGLLTILLLTWWPLIAAWLLAFVIKKILGDSSND
jgi:hypothetical protein